MALTYMYITNQPAVALVAQECGVQRIWIDLETAGKEERQKNLDTVKSNHSVSDIARLAPLMTTSELLVRVNSWHGRTSEDEIDQVIERGADVIMLPYWKTVDEVRQFVSTIGRRCKSVLLLETKEAVENLDAVLELGGFDEIHIGLNDLHLSYGLCFMFELLANGTVETLCKRISAANIPYGFGGVARLGNGALPAEYIVGEHYRLGSTRAILSRSFLNPDAYGDIDQLKRDFHREFFRLVSYERLVEGWSKSDLDANRFELCRIVSEIANERRVPGQ